MKSALGARTYGRHDASMRHRERWWMLPVMVALISPVGSALPAHAAIKAGASRVSITPDPKVMPYPLGGYVAPERIGHNAVGIHDTCYARALVLQNGVTRCAIVSLDLCFMPASVRTAVLSRIGKTGIPASALFLSSTHTHSAPDPLTLHSGNTGPNGRLPKFNPKLLDWMAARIAQAIIQANASLRPARAGSGQMEHIGLNRNRRGENLTDDEMTALKVTGADGKPLAAVFCYAAHPTYYGAENLEVSGDWAGAFERRMEQALPGAVVLFVNGAEGDASAAGADEGTASERIAVYSQKISEKARALYGSIATAPNPKLAAWTHEVTLPERRPHPFFVIDATMFGASPAQSVAYVKRMMPERSILSFVQVGDALFMGFPGEPTATIGLHAKEMAREREIKHPAVVALTNGWLGYILSPEQYRAGKYEASMSFFGDQLGERLLAGLQTGLNRSEAGKGSRGRQTARLQRKHAGSGD